MMDVTRTTSIDFKYRDLTIINHAKILFYDDYMHILGSEGGGNAGPVANFQI
jgi:hypothetical protein